MKIFGRHVSRKFKHETSEDRLETKKRTSTDSNRIRDPGSGIIILTCAS